MGTLRGLSRASHRPAYEGVAAKLCIWLEADLLKLKGDRSAIDLRCCAARPSTAFLTWGMNVYGHAYMIM